MTQWDQQGLCSARTQVQFLARHSGLKDLALLQLQRGSQLKSDPWPGNSICLGMAKKEKKKKNSGTPRCALDSAEGTASPGSVPVKATPLRALWGLRMAESGRRGSLLFVILVELSERNNEAQQT